MNFILNILILVVTFGFAGVYIFSLILNLRRALQANKAIKVGAKEILGKVIEVDKQKRRVYVKVEYVSPNNRVKFQNVFELTEKEFNDQYYVGQEVKIFYPNVDSEKKVNCFPIYLEGQKMGIEAGPLVTDIILVAGGAYLFVTVLLGVIRPDALGLIGLQWQGRPFIDMTRNWDTVTDATMNSEACFSIIYIFIIALFYFMLFSFLKERLTGMSSEHKNNYLKICGIRGMAEVKTFKFSKSRGQNGQKEAQMKIEFSTNKGEKIACDLSSYLYSETQEQFINILYDEKDPKNVVYMRK